MQIAQALFAADGSSIERLRLRLHPAELGTVEVVVENERTGRTRAALLVERAETLELLRRDLPTLERLFAQAGLALEPGGLELGLRGEGRRSDRGEAGEGAGAGAARSGAVVRGGATAAPASLYLVDLRV
ncbi:MAG: flagellar hook-length control protein FliK [Geminicoccaceae bacterium]|nr:flagellar hook-length control protein FliK [Geminicoccaceae bacterium]